MCNELDLSFYIDLKFKVKLNATYSHIHKIPIVIKFFFWNHIFDDQVTVFFIELTLSWCKLVTTDCKPVLL